MRINKYIAQATGLSRRAADTVIEQGRVSVNAMPPSSGQDITETDVVTLDGKVLQAHSEKLTIMLNKPTGYVCSRDGQGSKTIYDLLPTELRHLKPVGRLDKESSGLLLMTNDGDLANELTHPRYQKTKVYEVRLLKPLQPLHRQMISDYGVELEDGPSKLQLDRLRDGNDKLWQVTISEGRNRQIRRTFAAVGYTVDTLYRGRFGTYNCSDLALGEYRTVK